MSDAIQQKTDELVHLNLWEDAVAFYHIGFLDLHILATVPWLRAAIDASHGTTLCHYAKCVLNLIHMGEMTELAFLNLG